MPGRLYQGSAATGPHIDVIAPYRDVRHISLHVFSRSNVKSLTFLIGTSRR